MNPKSALLCRLFNGLKYGLLLCVIAFYSGASSATQEDLDSDIAHYQKIFGGSNFQKQRRALESLSWSGVSSPKVYDLIESKLKTLKNADSKAKVQEASWFSKALAYSGSDKYKNTLTDLASEAKSKKVRKYAEQSLTNLEQYKSWNSIISSNLAMAPTGRLQQTRVTNMLNASDLWLVRLGAKRVYHGHKSDQELISIAAKRLTSEYPLAKKSNDAQIDAIAWLIKALAESGEKQYQPLLKKIAKESKVKKVKKYAKKYADYLI